MNIKNFAITLCCFIFSLQGSNNRIPVNKKQLLKEHSLRHQIEHVFIPSVFQGSLISLIPAAKKTLAAYKKQNMCNKEIMRKRLYNNAKIFGKTFAVVAIPSTSLCILYNRYTQIKSEIELESRN